MTTKLKRYLVFRGTEFYPRGGWSDFKNSFDTIEAALHESEGLEPYEWAQVYDSCEDRTVHFHYNETDAV